MIRIITNNFWIKLLCIFIAAGVWVYVANNESKVDDFPGTIPLEVKNKPNELVVIKDTNYVQIKIVAQRGLWKKLSADSFEAYIDLSGYKEGTHEIPVTVNSSLKGVQIVQINPPKILTRLEPRISKKVKVRTRTEGQAAQGYIPGEPEINPESVVISGAKSIIQKISEAIAVIHLNGESEEITNKIISVNAYDENNKPIENVEFDPSEVSIDLGFIKATKTKTVGIKVKTSGKVADGYWISQITTQPETVIITGSSTALAQTNYISTNYVDINNLTNNKVATTYLNLPQGVSLISGQPEQVDVNIDVSQTFSQKEVCPKVNFQNLASSYKVSDINPNEIRVTLSGPKKKIQSISPDDVVLNIDLSGRSEGKFFLDLNQEMISLPEEISAINILPTSLQIQIESK